MTLTAHVLARTVLESGEPNRLRVGLPWFRSMPLSSIVGLELTVDDRVVPDVRLEVGGRTVAIRSLAEHPDDYWFLQDRHALEWSGSKGMGDRAHVVLRMRLHLPNLTRPDGGSAEVLQEIRAEVPVAAGAR